jgi:hypothetical protein
MTDLNKEISSIQVELARALVLRAVFEACSKDPSIVKDIIVAATEGVRAFADNQSDKATKLAFKLEEVLYNSDEKAISFGSHFTKEEVIASLEPWFGGTLGLKQIREKFGLDKPGDSSDGQTST